MADCYLLCNIIKCRKELKTQAWVTICSHIFCLNHGQNAVDQEKCLVCETEFSNKYDIVVMDLNPSEQHKSMIVTGLSPEKVLDIATRSITFWTYQIYQERLLRDTELRSAKQHSAEIADYCESIIAKHKVEIQKLHREIHCSQRELQEKSKQMDDFAMQLAEKSKLIKNLQSQNDSLKRTLANYIPSQGCYSSQPRLENMEVVENRSCNSNYKNSRPIRDERQQSGRISVTDTENKDFIFQPVFTPTFSNKYNF